MKIFKTFMFVAAFAAALTACQKDEQASAQNDEVKVHITAQSVDSRSAFMEPNGTTYPTRWSGSESVKFSLNLANTTKQATATTTDEGVTASFDTTLADDESGAYTIYGVSPATAAIAFSSSYSSITIEVPSTQTPLDQSCDEAAQVLVGQTNTLDALPEEVAMSFKHFTAYGLMSLKNFSATGEIATIALSSEANLTGRFYYYPSGDPMTVNTALKTLTLNTTKTANLWFSCVPADWSNTTLTVAVTMADGGVYTATKEFPANRVMESGKIAIFSVDMADAVYTAPVQYTLVTSPYALAVGDKLIIAAKEYDFACGTTQTNFRNSTAIVKDGNVILSPSESVEIFEVEKGDPTNFVFKATKTEGYLYNDASGSNYVKTKATATSWTLDIQDGVAILKEKTTATSRNWLRYNSSDPRFSCYASGQADLALYAISGGNTPAPVFSVSAETTEVLATATSASFKVTSNVAWTATISGEATFENGTKTLAGENVADVTIKFNENQTEEDVTYTVTVTTEAEAATKSYELIFTQAAKAAEGSIAVGTILWSENWNGFAANAVPATKGTGTVVYGGGTISYTCTQSGTKIYSSGTAYAGGTLPELLIAKSNGSLKVAQIPTGTATKAVLTFLSNKDNSYFSVTSSITGATVTKANTGLSWTITLPENTTTFDITIKNTSGSNARVDNLQVVVAE